MVYLFRNKGLICGGFTYLYETEKPQIILDEEMNQFKVSFKRDFTTIIIWCDEYIVNDNRGITINHQKIGG